MTVEAMRARGAAVREFRPEPLKIGRPWEARVSDLLERETRFPTFWSVRP